VSGLALPLVLSPGQATSFAVAFAPAATGSASGNVVVNSDATNSRATALFSGSGTAPVAHGIALSWTPGSATYIGFNIYRGSASAGPYARINSSLLPMASFSDTGIVSGQTYYYVATEVDATSAESAYSNEASAVLP
jgi:fibronectin type 3 domain-containing protein